ncbi:branched-chain amino acid ABC transporter permease [Halorientalis pallida]|uniref:Branched-chain amino acid ABC transporter permease n=1 Tax=Halorientalis pallida TaxID=2479928 RepID=A0A498KX97_9EURY|nr:branched-chain amino acid ABC transporter permease [Halorientalis pallida]RXK50242.1 branched-chain amino acid ABC transporter permease [Halorientalis pallida]
MSALGDRAAAVSEWFDGRSDAALLLALAAGLYALFTGVSLVLGYDLGGIVNTLRRITFLSAIYAMLVLALNLQWGYTGLFNLGVAGFMAVGVYTMGMLSTAPTTNPPGLGLPLPIGIAGGVVAAALVGAVASLPALRLRGDYLAIVTLAFSEIVRLTYRSPVFETFSVGGVALGTGGSTGMSLPTNPIRILFYENPQEVTSPPSAFGEAVFGAFEGLGVRAPVVEGTAYALVLLLFVAGVYVLLRRVGNSPFGRVLKAIREDETVAGALGKDTRLFKVKVFALGCALMGLAAILWRIGGIASTEDFRPITTFYVFVALIIGGAGSNTGSVVGGAVFASLLFEGPNFVRRVVTQYFEVGIGQTPNTIFEAVGPLASLDVTPLLAYTLSDVNVSALRLVLLGIVLIYLIQNRPEGLLGHRTETAASVDLGERPGGENR